MNTKYTLIIFGSFLILSILFLYLMITDNWNYFVFQLKWIMRIVTPLLIIYLFYSEKNRNKKKL
ncbi:MAG: hypothetical protein CMG64_02305 [Candidatus Marinimicrobia bacterium]|nr:hypothetical protein [Candidatus Neomarinimicrobiota bacterium]